VSGWSGHRWLALAARVALGGLFVWAAAGKIAGPAKFATDIDNYRLLPATWVNVVAAGLPWIELASGLLLVLGARVRAAAMLAGGMLVAFIGALAWAWARGIDVDCGCFGGGGATRVGPIPIVRDAGMLALAVYAYLVGGGAWALDGRRLRAGAATIRGGSA
jgi:uncharacterized membrane protein YphA (DoxX/SURF4 family)